MKLEGSALGNLSSVSEIKEQRFSINKNNTKIKDLNLSVRVKNACLAMGIYTLNDLSEIGLGELLKMRNFGIKSFNELKQYLNSSNIS